jgi:hypothetical protein
MAEIDAKKG